jgi:hypothetical protein
LNIEYFKCLAGLVTDASNEGVLLETEGLSGFSGDKLVGALQRLARFQEDRDGGCYLEVGVYQGLTLLSVASALKSGHAYGIDNFAQFDPDNKNRNVIEERRALNSIENVELINQDYEDALEGLALRLNAKKIGVYFVDGPHDYRSQYMCLGLAKPYLSQSAIIVVDDCNYRHVRQANRDFLILNPEYKLVFEAYTDCHPQNMSMAAKDEASRGWWNGVNILVRDPLGVLTPMYPPTIRSRDLYENEHIVHSSKFGYFAPEGVSIVHGLLRFNPYYVARGIIKSIKKLRKVSPDMVGEFPMMNTYSAADGGEQYNPALQ